MQTIAIKAYHPDDDTLWERVIEQDEIAAGESFEYVLEAGAVADKRPLHFAMRRVAGDVSDLTVALCTVTGRRLPIAETRDRASEATESKVPVEYSWTTHISDELGLGFDWVIQKSVHADPLEFTRLHIAWSIDADVSVAEASAPSEGESYFSFFSDATGLAI